MKKIKPLPGQESVWDYPRPPAIETVSSHIRIVFAGQTIYDHNESFRILETSHPPTYYLPKVAFKTGVLQSTDRTSFCEFKGEAVYLNVVEGNDSADFAAWGYPNPTKAFYQLKDHVSIYAHRMDACYLNDELVQAQEGDFYGGWITSKIVGPFKGAPGTWGW
ncbi:MAG: DUF427 domain-containing protein [Bacteroidota bacterium]